MKKADIYRNYRSDNILKEGVDKKNDALISDLDRAYFKKNLLPYLPSDKSSTIVELGCGYGKNIFLLKEHGYCNVRGIDLSEDQISIAIKKLSLSNILVANCNEWLKSSSEKFDCVLAIDLLEHLDLPSLFELGDLIQRSLNEKGFFLLQTPNGIAPLNPIVYGDVTHLRAFTVVSINQFLRMKGFDCIECFEVIPIGGGARKILSKFIWYSLFRPIISGIYRGIYGRSSNLSVLTANIVCRATK